MTVGMSGGVPQPWRPEVGVNRQWPGFYPLGGVAVVQARADPGLHRTRQVIDPAATMVAAAEIGASEANTLHGLVNPKLRAPERLKVA